MNYHSCTLGASRWAPGHEPDNALHLFPPGQGFQFSQKLGETRVCPVISSATVYSVFELSFPCVQITYLDWWCLDTFN